MTSGFSDANGFVKAMEQFVDVIEREQVTFSLATSWLFLSSSFIKMSNGLKLFSCIMLHIFSPRLCFPWRWRIQARQLTSISTGKRQELQSQLKLDRAWWWLRSTFDLFIPFHRCQRTMTVVSMWTLEKASTSSLFTRWIWQINGKLQMTAF